MTRPSSFINYPWHTILIASAVTFGIYFAGIFILAVLNPWIALSFLAYILFLEFRLLRYSCTNCYYYDKSCAFGRGKLSALLFKKGNPDTFNQKCISWKSMIPDILISLIPLTAGIYLLITDFNWLILFAMLAILGLTTAGNNYVRGSLACNSCKQKELGCPAYELFNKGN
ncbi:MAG: hypothetical protein JW801_14380 [Bacteroidales bacterium]|nr:hypothetical protein [Bacteroidales bacterium]